MTRANAELMVGRIKVTVEAIPPGERTLPNKLFNVMIESAIASECIFSDEVSREEMGCFLDDLTTLFIIHGGCAEQDECE